MLDTRTLFHRPHHRDRERRPRTRCALAIYAALAAALAAPAPALAAYAGFWDVDPTHWAASGGFIDWALEKGVVNGCGDGTLRVDEPLTRAQAAQMIWNYKGKPKPTGNFTTFADHGKLTWAKDAVEYCASAGIFGGVTDKNGNVWFYPDDYLTREQTIKVLYHLTAKNPPYYDRAEEVIHFFDDYDTIDPWAVHYVCWGLDHIIMMGSHTSSGQYVRAKSPCTRAEFIKMLKSTQDHVIDAGGGHPPVLGRLFTVTIDGDTQVEAGSNAFLYIGVYAGATATNVNAKLRYPDGFDRKSAVSSGFSHNGLNPKDVFFNRDSFGFALEQVQPGNSFGLYTSLRIPADATPGTTYTAYATFSADGVAPIITSYTITVI